MATRTASPVERGGRGRLPRPGRNVLTLGARDKHDGQAGRWHLELLEPSAARRGVAMVSAASAAISTLPRWPLAVALRGLKAPLYRTM